MASGTPCDVYQSRSRTFDVAMQGIQQRANCRTVSREERAVTTESWYDAGANRESSEKRDAICVARPLLASAVGQDVVDVA